jgi:hypothetical protein
MLDISLETISFKCFIFCQKKNQSCKLFNLVLQTLEPKLMFMLKISKPVPCSECGNIFLLQQEVQFISLCENVCQMGQVLQLWRTHLQCNRCGGCTTKQAELSEWSSRILTSTIPLTNSSFVCINSVVCLTANFLNRKFKQSSFKRPEFVLVFTQAVIGAWLA